MASVIGRRQVRSRIQKAVSWQQTRLDEYRTFFIEEKAKCNTRGGEMTTEQGSLSNQNDKIMAALAHVSAILPFMGVIAPIVIWVTQKDKSEYVAFQALQAIIYQLVMILAWFIGMGCYMLSFFGMFLTIPFTGSSGNPGSPVMALGAIIPFFVMGFMFIGGAVFVIYGLVGAIQVFQGKDFHYIIIGDRLVNYLKKNN
jgi:uncharacterized Tic20 family protein